MVSDTFRSHYDGKTVLLTGHTGFKGSWLALWLRHLGAKVVGFSLPPETAPNLHHLLGGDLHPQTLADIRKPETIKHALQQYEPDFVFHLAAQPLVRRSYQDPVLTVETNLMGTIHLLEGLRSLAKTVTTIIVTTDKCYENRSWDYGYRETDSMGGHDVYSMSKAACELAVASWRRSFFQTNAQLGPIATARAGNVIGGGDYADDRIVPDWVRAQLNGTPLEIRNPNATRPWQHVLDCLSGYLWLGVLVDRSPHSPQLASAFNFGPDLRSNVSVRNLVDELGKHWPGPWMDRSHPNAPHEASRLHLSIDKAASILGWHPTWDFSTSVNQTATWYRSHHEGRNDMVEFSLAQISRFCEDARRSAAPWA